MRYRIKGLADSVQRYEREIANIQNGKAARVKVSA